MTEETGRSLQMFTSFAGPRGASSFPVCRLGLASRGERGLTAEDVLYAIDRGVNFLNWCGCGHSDGLSQAVRHLGARRAQVMICTQLEARTAAEAQKELTSILHELATDHVDVLTFYYVEQPSEWKEITAPGGAFEVCASARRQGRVRFLGLTSHQRQLAAAIAGTGLIDMLMIRYNAAHRGAEMDIFPVTDQLGLPVVVYTCLRWGLLLQGTPDDPPGFRPPAAPAWYRFALQSPSVAVALSAPANRSELEENLTILNRPAPLTDADMQLLTEHGRRVRKHGGAFP